MERPRHVQEVQPLVLDLRTERKGGTPGRPRIVLFKKVVPVLHGSKGPRRNFRRTRDADPVPKAVGTSKKICHYSVTDYGSCGQNIFVSNVRVPWFFAIKIWFLEHHNFSFGDTGNNIPSMVGHYTQMVWYSSHKVGCGLHYCGRNVVKKPFYNYVCNYCPIGNFPERFGKPYTKGKPCSKCPGHCRSKKLCTNSCEHADFWVNCREIAKHWHQWLCGNPAKEQYKACRATCSCKERIK
ncbi:hypothetical protein V5799_003482 [Amblyomma americanum]|uniref:SCP domain-containing protein n=1 Tax=Amblyomma americanum TaxID=6943 RepID=A0AAQ4D8U5_AMBAM